MGRFKVMMSDLMSNFFIRIILCMVVLFFGALVVRFSSSMTAFATNDELLSMDNNQTYIVTSENQMYIETEEDNVIHIDLRDDSLDSVKKEIYEIEEKELKHSQYVVASLNQSDEYPEDWVSNFNKKIIGLQEIFPSGKYWNHMGSEATNPEETNNIYSVTDIPCNHSKYGEAYCNAHYGKSDEIYPYGATCTQCRGFASLLSDLIFGEDAPVTYFEDYDQLRIGDQARINGDYHSVFIIDKSDEYVIVAECNSDLETCQIQWGRKIMREDMAGWYITRWHD